MTHAFSDLSAKERTRFRKQYGNLTSKYTCWIWKGSFDAATAVFDTMLGGKRRTLTAIRVTLAFAGLSAPRAFTRSCDNFRCCNPYHVTEAEPLKPLEPAPERGYNAPQRNKFSLSLDGDNFLAALAPLRHDRSVSISMEVPRQASHRKGLSDTKRSLLILVPGRLAGIDPLGVLVAVVGSGSCVVWPLAPPKVANLVLAGMPVKLANVLMEKLRQTLLEK